MPKKCFDKKGDLDSFSLMRDLLSLYLSGFSENTQRSYRAILTDWLLFVGDPLAATRIDAMQFVASLRRRAGQASRYGGSNKVTAKTIHRKVVVLKAFYKFLERDGLASATIFDFPLKAPEKVPAKRPTECIPLEKIRALLEHPSPYTKKGIRDRSILRVMFYTGARSSEVCSLNVEDVRKRGKCGVVIFKRTKGGEPTIKPIPLAIYEELAILASQRLSEGALGSDPMFPTYHGKNGSTSRIGAKWLYRHFKKWCEAVGLDAATLSPHSSRVTVVTKLLKQGFDYGAVAQVTGHRSLEMVRRYDARFKEVEDSPALKIEWEDSA